MRGEPRLARLLDRTSFGRTAPRIGIRGTDFAGTIDAGGEGVTRWRPGELVFSWPGGIGKDSGRDCGGPAADRVEWLRPGAMGRPSVSPRLLCTGPLMGCGDPQRCIRPFSTLFLG